MKSEKPLFDLIKSLSSSEKRYISSSFSRGEGKYAALYRAISAQDEYDEAKIREQFAGETFLKQLSVAKSYLYDLLLRALRGYHRERTADIVMRGELDKIELLNLRGLYQHSRTILRKLKSKAIRLSAWPIHLECLQLQMRMVRRSGDPDLKSTLDALMKEQAQVLHLIQEEAEFRKLHDAVFRLRRRTEKLRGAEDEAELAHILSEPRLQGPPPTVLRLAVLYSYARLYAAQLRGDTDEVVAWYQELIAGWEADPQVMRHDQERYLLALLGYLEMFSSGEKEEEFEAIFAKIEQLKIGLPSLQDCRSTYLFMIRIRYLANHHSFQKAIAYVADHPEQLANVLSSSRQDLRMPILHNLLLLHFLEGEYHSALEFAEIIIKDKHPGLRHDVQLFARLLLLPIHFELGNRDILEFILRSSRRYFVRNTDLLPFEQSYFKHFRLLINAVDATEVRKIFQEFHSEMSQFAKTAVLLGLEEVCIWLQRKLSQ